MIENYCGCTRKVICACLGKKKGKESKMSRPFGVAMLIAGYDANKGPQLFFSDPSGKCFFFFSFFSFLFLFCLPVYISISRNVP